MRNFLVNITAGSALAATFFLGACGGPGNTAEETAMNVIEPDPAYEIGNDITAIDGTAGNDAGAAANATNEMAGNAAMAANEAAVAE